MAGNEGGGISAGMGDIEQLPREGILINIPLPGSMDFTGGNDQMASFALSV
jgi:hypothetical protein